MLHIAKVDENLAEHDKRDYFQGHVRTHMLVGAEESGELEVLAVYFSAGARTIPHIHDKDQVLHFIEGTGIVATETERHVCSAGDVVTVPGGAWHWHGATREHPMCHISIRQPGPSNWKVDLKDWNEY